MVLLLSSCLCFCNLVAAAASSGSASSTPNIVFILADDLGWFDVGFHGSEIKTPNIDMLAQTGVMLNNYYVNPLCTPTRSAILTGKYPIHTGLQHYVIVGSQPYGLPLKERTMAQHLKSLGYDTHAVGKWHLGFFKEDFLPTRRGFDSHLGYYLGKEDYFNHYSEDGSFYGYDFHENGQVLWNQTNFYSTDIFTSRAESIIHSHNKSKPLFLYMAHQAVHAGNRNDPLQVPQKYVDRFPYIKNRARRKFAGMVSALDDSVGCIYKALKDRGMARNTILVFSTDNGGPTNGYNRNAACNWPLRGCKGTLWQGGVRGVSFVHSPLLHKSGYVNNNLMHAVDWLPTLMSAVTTTKMSSASTSSSMNKYNKHFNKSTTLTDQLDGVDQWATLSKNQTTTRKEVLVNIDPIDHTESIIVGDFKLVRGQDYKGKYDGWYPPPEDVDDGKYDDSSKPGDGERYDDSSKPGDGESGIDNNDDYSTFGSSNYGEFSSLESKSELKKKADGDAENVDEIISQINSMYKTYKENHRNLAKPHSLLFKSENSFGTKESRLREEGILGDGNNLVNCGIKPANASTNCKPKHKPCLFHLTSDPCEYNNLAADLPHVLKLLKRRLAFYKLKMVPPGNKPIDPRGNPQLHGGVWQPWL